MTKSTEVVYVNPEDPSETWGGQGEMPKWIQMAAWCGYIDLIGAPEARHPAQITKFAKKRKNSVRPLWVLGFLSSKPNSMYDPYPAIILLLKAGMELRSSFELGKTEDAETPGYDMDASEVIVDVMGFHHSKSNRRLEAVDILLKYEDFDVNRRIKKNSELSPFEWLLHSVIDKIATRTVQRLSQDDEQLRDDVLILERLLGKGAKILQADSFGHTALHCLTYNGQVVVPEEVKELLLEFAVSQLSSLTELDQFKPLADVIRQPLEERWLRKNLAQGAEKTRRRL